MYWPGMYAQIEEMVIHVQHVSYSVQNNRLNHLKHMIYAIIHGKKWEQLCDYYSNYSEVCRFHNVSSQSVINAMKYVFQAKAYLK